MAESDAILCVSDLPHNYNSHFPSIDPPDTALD